MFQTRWINCCLIDRLLAQGCKKSLRSLCPPRFAIMESQRCHIKLIKVLSDYLKRFQDFRLYFGKIKWINKVKMMSRIYKAHFRWNKASFLAHLSTKCSWWAIVVSGCLSSVVVRRASSVNIWCLHSRDHICDTIF